MNKPRWTVVYNIVSPESDTWIGHGWEFFDSEADAQSCYDRHSEKHTGKNVGATKRPYYDKTDREHLGGTHQYWMGEEEKKKPETTLSTGVELGHWALPSLPAGHPDALPPLNITQEELTALMSQPEFQKELNDLMSKIDCIGPIHRPPR